MSPIRSVVRRRPLLAFVVLAYGFSWVGWLPLAATGASETPLALAVFTAVKFGPFAAALLVTWAVGGDVRAWIRGLLRWRVPRRYWLAALCLPALLVVAVGAAALAVTGSAVTLGHPLTYVSVAYPITWLLVIVAGGGQEEPGWRGFALPHLQRDRSALASSLLLGVAWLGWHLPLFAIPWSSQHGVSLLWWGTSLLAATVLFTWLYNATGGSVLLTAALHASVNTAPLLYLAGGETGFDTHLAYALFATTLALAAVLVVAYYGPEHLSSSERVTQPSGLGEE